RSLWCLVTSFLSSYLFALFLIPPPHRSSLFPYTTLFRSYLRERAETVLFNTYRDVLALLRTDANTERVEDLIEDDVLAQIDYQRSEEHTSELQSRENLVCRLLLEKKKKKKKQQDTTNLPI